MSQQPSHATHSISNQLLSAKQQLQCCRDMLKEIQPPNYITNGKGTKSKKRSNVNYEDTSSQDTYKQNEFSYSSSTLS